MQNLFLIGGSGFIGKHLARHLSARYHVSVYDKQIDADFFAACPSIQTTALDLAETLIPASAVSPDYIINLASVVTAERDLSLFDALIGSNLKILLNLYTRFKDAATLKLFIQFGSSEEYGSENAPFEEDNRECPNSPYALVKQLTTHTALMLHRNAGFPAMVVRPGNLFGPWQNPSKFIPYIVTQLRAGKPLDVSPSEQKRDFMYIDDFVQAIESVLQNHSRCVGQIVNVSSGESCSLKTIIEYCKQQLKSASPVHYGAIPYRANEAMNLTCSIEKLARLTGYKPPFDTLQRLTDYLNTHQA